MANPEHLSPDKMAASFGVGGLARHLFICLGPECCSLSAGEEVWEYVKKRMKELGLAGKGGSCFRTKAGCLRICTAGPVAVVYPEGAWYRDVTVENAERIIQEHLIGGRVVDEICFARDGLERSRE